MGDNDPWAGPFLTPGAWLAGFIKRTTTYCYIQNMKALGLVVSEKKIFVLCLYEPQGHGWQENMKALRLVVSEKNFFCFSHCRSMGAICCHRKVQVGKDQEKAQSERDSHSKNRGGKKPNQQSGTYTMKHIVSRMSSYFPNRWPLSYLNLIKNMKTYIRRQQQKKFKHQDIKQKEPPQRSIALERSVTQSYWRA